MKKYRLFLKLIITEIKKFFFKKIHFIKYLKILLITPLQVNPRQSLIIIIIIINLGSSQILRD